VHRWGRQPAVLLTHLSDAQRPRRLVCVRTAQRHPCLCKSARLPPRLASRSRPTCTRGDSGTRLVPTTGVWTTPAHCPHNLAAPGQQTNTLGNHPSATLDDNSGHGAPAGAPRGTASQSAAWRCRTPSSLSRARGAESGMATSPLCREAVRQAIWECSVAACAAREVARTTRCLHSGRPQCLTHCRLRGCRTVMGAARLPAPHTLPCSRFLVTSSR